MNIILDTQITPEIQEKYMLLELDTFKITESDTICTAWCLVEPPDHTEMMQIQQFVDLHANLMPNYRKQNWDYVEQAIEHLLGRWDNQLDSFYNDLLARIASLRHDGIDPEWDGSLQRSIQPPINPVVSPG
jgi:hypothetical protein